MGTLGDLRGWLNETPLWRELGKVPTRLDALEARMAAMEERLKTRPGETCPKCGEHAVRLQKQGRVFGSPGKQQREDTWMCGNCEHSEVRVVRL